MTNNSTLKELHAAWGAADRAWSVAIEKSFPKEWPGDVRFQPKGKGEEGSTLRAAYDAKRFAQDAFYAAGGAEWLQTALLGRPAIVPNDPVPKSWDVAETSVEG